LLAIDEAEMKIKTYVWNLTDPLVTIFNMIEDFAELSRAGGLEWSTAQLINYGLNTIRKTNEFERALTEWFNRPEAEKTWLNFKKHFTQALRELKRIRGPTLRSTAFHQAHQMAEELSFMNTNFDRLQETVMNSVQTLSHQINDSYNQRPLQQPTQTPIQSNSTETDTMNATTNTVNTEMLRLIQQMQEQMTKLSTNYHNNGYQGRGYGGRGNGGRGRGNRNGGRGNGNDHRYRRNVSKYCWTHGACAHTSANCASKAEGHCNEATFANKMGGNTRYCANASNE
jgi:hypothetical protein